MDFLLILTACETVLLFWQKCNHQIKKHSEIYDFRYGAASVTLTDHVPPFFRKIYHSPLTYSESMLFYR